MALRVSVVANLLLNVISYHLSQDLCFLLSNDITMCVSFT